jgi:hypothetical protein
MDYKNSQKDKTREQFIRPIQDGRFQFSCHKDVPCFTDCCRDLRLILTPYDIIRIKNRLGIFSKEFLDKYTFSEFDNNMGLPIVLLKMKNDERRRCPFVSPEGCTIYKDRPGACRIYPIGRAAQKESSEKEAREHYFIVKEPHCLGFKEKRIWTIKEWLMDQEVEKYNAMNDYWMEIITSPHPLRHQGLNDKKLQMFYMTSYNVDLFKEFVFSSKFLKLFKVEKEILERIREDEVEMMKFGFRWMKFSLFGEDAIKVKEEVLQAKKEKMAMR